MKKIIVFSIIVLLLSIFLASAEVYVIKKPDALSKWSKGSTKVIKWDKKGDSYPNVKIRLYTSPGEVKVQDITNSAPNNESFSWKIPYGTDLGKYFIRVRTLNNAKWGDSKEFEIVTGQIKPGVLKDAMRRIKQKPTFKPPKGFMTPKIKIMLDDPLGAMKPGTKLILLGENFGTQKGKVIVKGNFPGGQFELINVNWVSTKSVNGFVPQSINGQPNQSVEVILVTAFNFKSDPWKMSFEGREEKVLNSDVVGVNCGSDANDNICNKVVDCESEFLPGPFGGEYAISGYHNNVWGAVGDDVGNDVFSINLKNGWVFKSMQKTIWKKTSGDEVLSGPAPSFPAGQSSWAAIIHWKVTPNDYVMYKIKIIVEGPIGTNYK